MKSSTIFSISLIGLLLSIGCQSSSKEKNTNQTKASSPSLKSNDIELSGAWARPAAGGGHSAAYLNIYNGTNAADTLIDVTSDVAGKTEIHESFEKNNMAGMRPAGRQVIAADSTLELKPGHLHIMLMQLNHALAKGDSISLQLEFTGSGSRKISVPVKTSDSNM